MISVLRNQIYYCNEAGQLTSGPLYLRQQRLSRRYTQREFAAYLGYYHGLLSAWEQGAKPLSKNAVASLLSIEPGFRLEPPNFRTNNIERLPTRYGILALRRILLATAEDFAQALDVSTHALRSWELERRRPSPRAYERMLRLLDGRSPEDIYLQRYARLLKDDIRKLKV